MNSPSLSTCSCALSHPFFQRASREQGINNTQKEPLGRLEMDRCGYEWKAKGWQYPWPSLPSAARGGIGFCTQPVVLWVCITWEVLGWRPHIPTISCTGQDQLLQKGKAFSFPLIRKRLLWGHF